MNAESPGAIHRALIILAHTTLRAAFTANRHEKARRSYLCRAMAFASVSTATSISTATSTALQHKAGKLCFIPSHFLAAASIASPDSILSIAGIVSIGLKYNPRKIPKTQGYRQGN
jgi:hypothetical protein